MVKYIVHDGTLRPWAEVAALRRERARSALPCPYVIGDHLDDVQNPADGKVYDSKSEYYKAIRAAGCEIVGNEAEAMAEKGHVAKSEVQSAEIGEALHKVKQGYKPAPLGIDPELEKIAHG
jgi:hypothetical protein